MTGTRSLVADIGATNARFGLLDAAGRLLHSQTLPCTSHATLEQAARAYLATAQPDAHPVEGAIAIAGPVTGDLLTMTNHPWTFSVKGTRGALGLGRLVVVNDFTAAAMAMICQRYWSHAVDWRKWILLPGGSCASLMFHRCN